MKNIKPVIYCVILFFVFSCQETKTWFTLEYGKQEFHIYLLEADKTNNKNIVYYAGKSEYPDSTIFLYKYVTFLYISHYIKDIYIFNNLTYLHLQQKTIHNNIY
jgi:hypothetical protein